MKIAVIQLLDKPCVRTRKVISSFLNSGHDVTFIGVDRGGAPSINNDYEVILLGKKIERGTWKKVYLQFFFFLAVRSYLNKNDFDNLYCVDLDGVIPAYLSKYKSNYIYDVLDTYADRYKLPGLFKIALRKLESHLAERAKCLIHVDQIRVPTLNTTNKNLVIVENVPQNSDLLPLSDTPNKRECFLISGGVFKHRGLEQILEAHKIYCLHNEPLELKIIGSIGSIEKEIIEKYLFVNPVGLVSSSEAQSFASRAYAVFAMYEPTSNININACPNKIYDCLFNATPAIINSELKIAERYQDAESVISAPYYDISAIANAMSNAVAICENSSSLFDIANAHREDNNWDAKFKIAMEKMRC